MLKHFELTAVGLLACWVAASACAGDTGTDPAHLYAWGENAGWLNAGPTNSEVTIHFDGNSGWLSGYAWAESIGWINFGDSTGGPYNNNGAADWGVNVASNGRLSGYAWCENAGWINFGHALCDAAINTATGDFSGRAWGENIGWVMFRGTSPAYGVRTLAFDTQAQGSPNWWLDCYSVTESYDAGDGVPAWQKYVMDADPRIMGNFLRITAVSNSPSGTAVAFGPASARRYYTLVRRENLRAGVWDDVPGQVRVPVGGGTQTLRDTNTASQAVFRVDVTVAP